MRTFFTFLLFLVPMIAVEAENKIVPVDSSGRRQYHLQQYVVDKGRLIPVDSAGRKQYHKQTFVKVIKK